MLKLPFSGSHPQNSVKDESPDKTVMQPCDISIPFVFNVVGHYLVKTGNSSILGNNKTLPKMKTVNIFTGPVKVILMIVVFASHPEYFFVAVSYKAGKTIVGPQVLGDCWIGV